MFISFLKKFTQSIDNPKPKQPKPQPSFHLSGKLAEEQRTLANGVVLKFSEPIDKHMPTERYVLIPFKDNKALGNYLLNNQFHLFILFIYLFVFKQHLESVYLDKSSCYLMGRDRTIADIALDHPSCSSQHAVIQFRQIKIQTEEGVKNVVR